MQATETNGNRLQNVTQAAAYLSTSRRRIMELLKSGALAGVRDSGRVKIRTAELDRYIADLPAYEPVSA